MIHSLFGDLAILQNFIYSDSTDYKKIEKAKRIRDKIMGNYKLTKSDLKFIEELDKNRKVVIRNANNCK